MNKRIILWAVVLLLFSGCASYHLEEAQSSLRSSFATHNFDETITLLQKYNRKDVYRSKDQVLYNLEMGTATHFQGSYDSSSVHFGRAEQQIDELFTRSVSRGVASFLFTNDNSLAYNGEAYEDIYINAFKSLNFIHRNELESALVEARRMAYKLSRVELKYKGLAESLARADTLGRGDWKPGVMAVQDSPFSHYLAAVLYAASGKGDDARIEYEKMLQALNNHALPVNRAALQSIRDGSRFNVLLVGFAGRAPLKYQNDVRLYLDEHDLYLKFSLPALRLYQSRVAGVQAVVNDTLQVPLQLIERMDMVAREVYKVKEPIIYARTFVRSLAKAVGTNAAGRAIEEEHEGLGMLVNLLGKVGQEFTEKADTRSWQTMPGQAYVHALQLPPGSHTVELQYRDARGRVLYTHRSAVNISPRDRLNLLESLYWN